jgi:adenylate kinase
MILIMGVAGAGKGTQAKMLVDKNGYSLVSTGDLLRTRGSEDQKKRMLSGQLLTDPEIFELIGKELSEVPDLSHCIIDGTPRSIPQADWLLEQATKVGFEISGVINITVDESVVRQRLLARNRSDDTEAGITKRFEEYRNNTLPIIDYLKSKGIPIHQIDGDQDPQAVHNDIVAKLEPSN